MGGRDGTARVASIAGADVDAVADGDMGMEQGMGGTMTMGEPLELTAGMSSSGASVVGVANGV